MTGFIAIDGVEVPTPVTCQMTEYDFDSSASGRTEAGYMHRERVRTKLLAIDSIVWDRLSPEQARLLRGLLLPVTIAVTVRTPAGETTRNMTAGDLHWEPAFDRNGTEHWNLSTKLSEN